MGVKSYYIIEGIIENYIVFRNCRELDKNGLKDTCAENKYNNNYNKLIRCYLKNTEQMGDIKEYTKKYFNIDRHYIIVQLDKKLMDSMISQEYEYDIVTDEMGRMLIKAYSGLFSLKSKLKKVAECRIVADFTYMPSFRELFTEKETYIENLKSNVAFDIDYLYLYGYLCERKCNNSLIMGLINFLSDVNVYKYNKHLLWGISKEIYEYITRYVTDDKFLVLLQKSIKRYDKATEIYDKKYGNKMDKRYIKHNKKLYKTFMQYKKTDEGRKLLSTILYDVARSYSKSEVQFIKQPESEEELRFVENIITHKYDKSVVELDKVVKENGFEGEFPIYYRKVDEKTQIMGFSVKGIDEDLQYLESHRDDIIEEEDYDYRVYGIMSTIENKSVTELDLMIADTFIEGNTCNIGCIAEKSILGGFASYLAGIFFSLFSADYITPFINKYIDISTDVIEFVLIAIISAGIYYIKKKRKADGKDCGEELVLENDINEMKIKKNIDKQRVFAESCINILDGKSGRKVSDKDLFLPVNSVLGYIEMGFVRSVVIAVNIGLVAFSAITATLASAVFREYKRGGDIYQKLEDILKMSYLENGMIISLGVWGTLLITCILGYMLKDKKRLKKCIIS